MDVKENDQRVADLANPLSELRNAERRAAVIPPSQEVRDHEAKIAQRGINDQENGGGFVKSSLSPARKKSASQSARSLRSYINLKSARGKSSIITLAVILIGGGAAMTATITPAYLLVHMKEVVSQYLDDRTHSVSVREGRLLAAKLKGTDSKVKVADKFGTLSDNAAENLKEEGITATRDKTGSLDTTRGKVMKFESISSDGTVTDLTTPEQFLDANDNNVDFRSKLTSFFNPKFESYSDSVFANVLRKIGISKKPVTEGATTDEERQKRLNDVVEHGDSSSARTLVSSEDEKTKKTTYSVDGTDVTDQVPGAEASDARIKAFGTSGGVSGLLKNAARGAVGVVAVPSLACTGYSAITAVSGLMGTIQKVKQERLAFQYVSEADMIKAGAATEAGTTFYGNSVTATHHGDATVDASKLDSNSQIQSTSDPDNGKSASDALGIQMANGGIARPLNLREQQYSFGPSSDFITKAQTTIANIVSGGNNDPSVIRNACHLINNPVVQGATLAFGILSGVGTFGLSSVVGIGASASLSLFQPYLEAHAADILSDGFLNDVSDVSVGDVIYSGTAGFQGDAAMASGEKPLSATEVATQLQANQQTENKYAETQRYLARTDPFNIMNQYSFLGSIAFSMAPLVQNSQSSASAAMMSMASLIPTAIGTIIPTTHAAAVADDYTGHCTNPNYTALGIAAGPYCEVRYGNSEAELEMDPVENAIWMANTGNIDADSDTGAAKDNGQSWNYVKFLSECVNRTVAWGMTDDSGEGDGANCTSTANEEQNKHFRIYTMDQAVDAMLDKSDTQATTPGTTGFTNGQTAVVNNDGWAFPTDPDDTITVGYKTQQNPDHGGVNIAGKDDATTSGQPIFAARDGKVIASGPSADYGNWIVIENDINGVQYSTVYGHMDDNGLLVKLGDTVKAGQEIGYIGRKNTSGSPYLYFELWQGLPAGLGTNGSRIDPTGYLKMAQDNAKGVRNV